MFTFINLSLTCCNERKKTQVNFLKGPYIIYENNNTEMTILWQTDSLADVSEIEWGPTPDYGNGPFSASVYGDNQYKYKITGLTPEILYYYRVNVDGVYQTGTFKTAPQSSAQSIIFYAYGDTRTQPDKQNEVVGSLLNYINQSPDQRQTMLLHSGDWVSNGDEEDKWNTEFFNRSYPNLIEAQKRLPIMGARGNHEGSANLLKKYFPYPYVSNDGCYYSFDYGPAHITIIDDNIDRNPNTNQYNWILNDLSNSSKPWNIVLFHQPAWGAGTHGNNTTNQMLTSNIFEINKVVIAVTGHDHIYGHCYKKPIHHITTGGGGAPLYDINPNAPYYLTASKNYHFTKIEINNNLLCLTAIGTSGEIYDTFCMDNQAPGDVGNTLLLTKENENIKLTWLPPGNVCFTTSYAIYRGTLPLISYNHTPKECLVSETYFLEQYDAQSNYYLVVSNNGTAEGSYGKDSSGAERPQSASPCLAQNSKTC